MMTMVTTTMTTTEATATTEGERTERRSQFGAPAIDLICDVAE